MVIMKQTMTTVGHNKLHAGPDPQLCSSVCSMTLGWFTPAEKPILQALYECSASCYKTNTKSMLSS